MLKLKRLALFILTLLSLVIIMFYSLQEKLIFLPTQLPKDYEYSFSHDFEEIFLDTPDGAVLNALHFKTDKPKGLVLYFHGNAGDLSRWGFITSDFVDLGYDVLVMDYRGYGKSTGERSEKALYEDAQRFYDHAKEIHQEDKIIVYGRSLGSGIAAHLASNNNPKKLILETPYYSLVDVAQDRFPILPVKSLLKYKMNSFEYIQKVQAPIRIFHGTEDKIVPYESGNKLYKSIPHSNKKLYTIPNGEHNNLNDFEVYQNGIRNELE